MEVIRSAQNERIKKWNSLKLKKYREQYGLFIIQQPHLITEALKSGNLETLIIREGCQNSFDHDAVFVSDEVMKKLSDNQSLNDCIAICRMMDQHLSSPKRLIVLENVQDPGNVGTIIRTAHSFGYDGVLLTTDCADIYNWKTISACQGSLFHIPVIRKSIEEIVDYLKTNHLTVLATDLQESHFLRDIEIPERFALIFGNEGSGISEYVRENSDMRFKIEMDNFDSLNVACAAAVAGYVFRYGK